MSRGRVAFCAKIVPTGTSYTRELVGMEGEPRRDGISRGTRLPVILHHPHCAPRRLRQGEGERAGLRSWKGRVLHLTIVYDVRSDDELRYWAPGVSRADPDDSGGETVFEREASPQVPGAGGGEQGRRL